MGGILRYIFLILSSAAWLAVGKFILNLESIIDLIHFASIPSALSYLFIFKPKIQKSNLISYSVCFSFIALIIFIYFLAFANAIPEIRINWVELPIALYFLTSIYLILWLVDKFVNSVFFVIFKNLIRNKTVFAAARTTLRVGVLIFVVAPYLIALFVTHWVKFADAQNPASLKNNEYSQIEFSSSDGANLKGWFISSQNHVSDSTVIIVPGRSAAKNLFLPYAKVFSESGYNVLLFDLRGNGGSSGHKYSFAVNEVNDVIAAVDFLRKEKPQLCNYIFGYGLNEGAAALIGAAAIDERFAAIVSDNASGYEISMPDWLNGRLPNWAEKSFLQMTKTFVSIDIGHPIWGNEGIYERISEVSPCPILFTNSIKNSKCNRLKTIELFSKARDPKNLWLAPLSGNPGVYDTYFYNVLQTFEIGKSKQKIGNWRISKSY
jgi:pimeloyl-ACP methyl ester carboxylesterase